MKAQLRRLTLLLILALGLSGCQRLSTGARENFAKDYSCPEDRITVQERDDLLPSQIYVSAHPRENKPPAEVAADPGRLEKWKSIQAANHQRSIDFYDDRFFSYPITVFEVSGCDHTVFIGCSHAQSGFDADCDEGHPPNPD